MIVKKIILISFFLFGNFLVLLGLFYKKVSIGFFWYSINSNSLVGLQSLLEKYSYYFDKYKIDINKHLFFFLDINLFSLIGAFFLLFPCFLSVKLSSS
jgi:hypothetical protein